VRVPAASSASYLTLDEKNLFSDPSNTDRDKDFLVVDLEIMGQHASRNTLYFDVTHNLDLPVNPKIENHVTKSPSGYVVTLKSSELARSLYVSFGDLDTHLSDNYFDLLPGETVTVQVESPATLDQLQGAMKLMSITDAYASQGTHY